ncbi:hypothetical protein HC174_07695 [Salinimicrobium sp. CDJ15-81-2]|nr:hypothetical protein [Salinimicrobium nanhaiense]
MRLEEAIQKLDRSVGNPGTKSSVKIKQRFSNILQEVKYKNLPQEQLSLLEQELNSIFKELDLEGKKAEVELRHHLKKLLKFLRINFSLVPEGYFAMYGMRIGLAAGLILLLFLYFYTESGYTYYSPLGGLLIGVMLGSLCDKREKVRGRSLLTRMV